MCLGLSVLGSLFLAVLTDKLVEDTQVSREKRNEDTGEVHTGIFHFDLVVCANN